MALALGLMVAGVLLLTLTGGPSPRLWLEALPPSEWGFGGLPRGTAYYFNLGNTTCVFYYGHSTRLGVVRVITSIHAGSLLAHPRSKTPPSAR